MIDGFSLFVLVGNYCCSGWQNFRLLHGVLRGWRFRALEVLKLKVKVEASYGFVFSVLFSVNSEKGDRV